MSTDRTITWRSQGGQWVCPKSGLRLRPTRAHLRMAAEDYFRYLGAVEDRADQKRLYVSLPGTPTSPSTRLAEQFVGSPQQQRWIEVYYGDLARYVSVITRLQDEATNALADGFAQFCQRFWQGEMEDCR